MKNRGFTFIEVIFAMAILGIITVFHFSNISLSHNGFQRISIRNEMNYIGEMVIENLKTNDPYTTEVFEELNHNGSAIYISDKFDDNKYSVSIFNDYESDKTMEISVKVSYNYEENNPEYVEFKATVPKK